MQKKHDLPALFCCFAGQRLLLSVVDALEKTQLVHDLQHMCNLQCLFESSNLQCLFEFDTQ